MRLPDLQRAPQACRWDLSLQAVTPVAPLTSMSASVVDDPLRGPGCQADATGGAARCRDDGERRCTAQPGGFRVGADGPVVGADQLLSLIHI